MTDENEPSGGTDFDFWLGTWDVTWPAEQVGGESGQFGSGTNRIQRVLDGKVIEENFTIGDGSFRGHSVSVFDQEEGIWRQTWVDSGGGYLLFTGGMQDREMTLVTEPVERDGEMVINRMVFRDIEDDSLRWDWQSSRDQGTTWKDLWNISYRRAEPI